MLLFDGDDALSLAGQAVHHATADTFGVEFTELSNHDQKAVGEMIGRLHARICSAPPPVSRMSSNETKEVAASAAKAAVEAYGPPTRVILRVIFILLVVVGLLWIISKITGIILLLVLSIFFAYLVSPLV